MNISLILPCYNETANIQKGALDKVGNFTKNNSYFGEVIIVDDGSTDDSKKTIKEKYLPLFPKFQLIENKHSGKAFAIIGGIQKATGDYIMFCDMDLATPIEEAGQLIKAANGGSEIIIGSRNSRREGAPFTRKLMALGMIFIREYFITLRGIKDTQCGFKLFQTAAARNIIQKLLVFKKHHAVSGSSVSAGFDLEFLFLAKKLGYKITEIAVTWKHVETKNVTFIKSSMDSLKDILLIKYYDATHRYKT